MEVLFRREQHQRRADESRQYANPDEGAAVLLEFAGQQISTDAMTNEAVTTAPIVLCRYCQRIQGFSKSQL